MIHFDVENHKANQAVVDERTPEELIEIIEARGREIAEALAALRRAAEV